MCFSCNIPSLHIIPLQLSVRIAVYQADTFNVDPWIAVLCIEAAEETNEHGIKQKTSASEKAAVDFLHTWLKFLTSI